MLLTRQEEQKNKQSPLLEDQQWEELSWIVHEALEWITPLLIPLSKKMLFLSSVTPQSSNRFRFRIYDQY